MVNREIWTICRSEPWNFANWSAEFGKIYHGKLWALFASSNSFSIICTI